MTRRDDLEPGQYIAIVDCLDVAAYCRFNAYADAYESPKFDGRPLEILAVSLPFLCVTDGIVTFALDLNAWEVQRVTREYAEAMLASRPGAAPPIPTKGKRRKKSVFAQAIAASQQPDPQACPRCGDRMVQVLNIGSGWQLICRQCGNNGGPVQVVQGW